MDSTLKRVPNEIIQEVASYLSMVDKLSFALVHPIVYRALGRDSWKEILEVQKRLKGKLWLTHARNVLWNEFLALIRRAFNQYWWCDRCLVLHPCDVNGVKGYEDSKYGAVDVGPGGVFKGLRTKLDPRIVHGVMEKHFKEWNGLCPEYLASYSSWEPETTEQMADMNISTEFRSCQLLWQGRWDFTWSGIDIPKDGDIFTPLRQAGFRFCRHLIWKAPWISWLSSPSSLDSSIRKDGQNFSCKKCSTSLNATVRELDYKAFKSVQVTIQVKKNFGARTTQNDSHEFANHFSKKVSHSPDTRVLDPDGDNLKEPLFYQCDYSHGEDCYLVRHCVHHGRDMERIGKKPKVIDPERHVRHTWWLRMRALGYDDDYYDST